MNETINVTGNIILQQARETNTTEFTEHSDGSADLTSYSAGISAASPDLDKNTPSGYTSDWDPNTDSEFFIALNSTTNRIQIFTNQTSSLDHLYFINIHCCLFC